MSDEVRESTAEEKERMRKGFEERMKRSAEKVHQQLGEEEERCPHGVPLSKTCVTCDTVTPDQIQNSIKLV